ncbi:calcium-binding protein [Actibacterium lipolyticum]|uniref:Hemolysin, chromosomal n=1 Tax=Actibacterium lipolyticum TaxID=1524263 RepID=A0A238JQ00_9RHOB|nr:calcium-binding protein [Actibacterium lipolyticum]SMX32615.1 Hemolysin, chromosomal [Actibacterium lipolyticum]
MTTATSYLSNVNQVQNDINAISSFSEGFDIALSASETVLALPGKIEQKLRSGADTLNLPSAVVTALSFAPFGIGTAIKTLDNIAGETADVIEEQADIMGALDDAWAQPRNLVDIAQAGNDVAGNGLSALGTVNAIRLDEAGLLVESLGDQEIHSGSQLATRLESYSLSANSWFMVRDTLLAPLQAALTAFEAAIDSVENLVPDLSLLDDTFDTISDVFQPLADAAAALEDALCVVFTITPAIVIPPIVVPPVVVFGVTITPGFTIPGYTIPAVVVDVCSILDDIGNAVGVVQDFVENTINSILNALGFDLFGAIDDLKDLLLSPLDPVFDAIDALLDTFQPVLDALDAAMNEVTTQLANIIASIEDVVDQGSLFANTIIGDEAPNLIDFADTLIGTDGEDGIYGLEGDDDISGGGGSDFLFGGNGNDTLSGGAGNDEMFGGEGNDIVFAGFGNNLLDGGAGDDLLIGQNGSDILIGGSGKDFLIGGGGSDEFIFGAGGGTDLLIGFEDDVDELQIDQDMLSGVMTAAELIDEYAVTFNGHTILRFDEERIVLVGVANANDLVDDLVFV